MNSKQRQGEETVRDDLDDLTAQIAVNRADLDTLHERADRATRREVADQADTALILGRLQRLESRAEVDRGLIADLQADGVAGRREAADTEADLRQALRTSRMIGAAIGIVMAAHKTTEAEAFATLSRASQAANRKLRDIAADIVDTGDVSGVAGG